jgi:hypothetical protein
MNPVGLIARKEAGALRLSPIPHDGIPFGRLGAVLLCTAVVLGFGFLAARGIP